MDYLIPPIYYFFYYTSMFGGIYLFIRILQIHVIGELKDMFYEHLIFGTLEKNKPTEWRKL